MLGTLGRHGCHRPMSILRRWITAETRIRGCGTLALGSAIGSERQVIDQHAKRMVRRDSRKSPALFCQEISMHFRNQKQAQIQWVALCYLVFLGRNILFQPYVIA
jgi:hypothetical protein